MFDHLLDGLVPPAALDEATDEYTETDSANALQHEATLRLLGDENKHSKEDAALWNTIELG